MPVEVKCCIIGDTDVGKTCMTMRYCHGEFPNNATPTIGASFLQKRVSVDDNFEISLQLWDTAGQERFRSMAPMYYRSAKAAILTFDVTNEDSFHRVVSWLKDLRAHADPNVVILLAGNKIDKTPSFDLRVCEEYAASIGSKLITTSALSGQGIYELFDELAKRVVRVLMEKEKMAEAESGGVRLGQSSGDKAAGCC